VVLRQVVPKGLTQAALARIKNAKKGENLYEATEMTDLVNKSPILQIVTNTMGAFDPPTACQVGVTKISKPGDSFTALGYREKDMPYFGAQTHIDGYCTINPPQTVQQGNPDEIYMRYIASGPRGDLGKSPSVIGHNTVPLFQDPEMTLGLGSFTAFIGVCLNDQTVNGRGNFAVLKGAHHAVEAFFRKQKEAGTRMGPEGPGWPRLDYNAPNRCGLTYLPKAIHEQFLDETSEYTPDGRRWARPTPILMDEGDAILTVFNLPHAGTRNELGTESRKNIYFRIRAKKRQPRHVVNGVTDYPDRGPRGAWLEYEEGNNPWEKSKHAMCNMWEEWEGMSDVVASEQRKKDVLRSRL